MKKNLYLFLLIFAFVPFMANGQGCDGLIRDARTLVKNLKFDEAVKKVEAAKGCATQTDIDKLYSEVFAGLKKQTIDAVLSKKQAVDAKLRVEEEIKKTEEANKRISQINKVFLINNRNLSLILKERLYVNLQSEREKKDFALKTYNTIMGLNGIDSTKDDMLSESTKMYMNSLYFLGSDFALIKEYEVSSSYYKALINYKPILNALEIDSILLNTYMGLSVNYYYTGNNNDCIKYIDTCLVLSNKNIEINLLNKSLALSHKNEYNASLDINRMAQNAFANKPPREDSLNVQYDSDLDPSIENFTSLNILVNDNETQILALKMYEKCLEVFLGNFDSLIDLKNMTDTANQERIYMASIFCINYLFFYQKSNPEDYLSNLLKSVLWKKTGYFEASNQEYLKFINSYKSAPKKEYLKIFEIFKDKF